MKRKRFYLFCAFVFLLAIGCKQSSRVVVVSVSSRYGTTLYLGEGTLSSIQLTCSVSSSDGKEVSVVWISSDPSIADVNQNGLVTAMSTGKVIISAIPEGSDGDFNASFFQTLLDGGDLPSNCIALDVVKQDEQVEDENGDGVTHVKSVRMSEQSLTLGIGNEAELIAFIAPVNSADKSIAWYSSDNSKVSVEPVGEDALSQRAMIKALGESANTVITAVSRDGGYMATANIAVVAASGNPIKAESLSICLYDDPSFDLSSGLYLSQGESRKLYAAVSPANAVNAKCSFLIEADSGHGYSPNAVTIDGDVVTAVEFGKKCKIKAVSEDGGLEAYLDVTVMTDTLVLPDASLTDESADVLYETGDGETIRLVAGKDIQGADFKSSADYVTIDEDGVVTVWDANSHYGESVEVTVTYSDGSAQSILLVIGYAPEVEFRIWDDQRGEWVAYQRNDMKYQRNDMKFFDATFPYPSSLPEAEYKDRLYVISDWVIFPYGYDVESYYFPTSKSLGKIATPDDIKKDSVVYARYKLKDIDVDYYCYDQTNSGWVKCGAANMKSGDAFRIPDVKLKGIIRGNLMLSVVGWTALDLSKSLPENVTLSDIEESGLLTVDVNSIKDSSAVYAVYEKLSYPALIRIAGTNNAAVQGKEGISLSEYYISDHEVTHDEWEMVYGKDSDPSTNKEIVENSGEDSSLLPVESVSWFDAVQFCNKLSEMDGLEQCYSYETVVIGGKYKSGWVCDWSKNGYRLPSETEWEYAARGGEDCVYSGDDVVNNVAWLCSGKKHQVKKKQSNGFGLFDMSGNVSEGCWDWYEVTYGGKGLDYVGPDTSTSTVHRVYRGGQWNMDTASSCQVGKRYGYSPSTKDIGIGFRVCRSSM